MLNIKKVILFCSYIKLSHCFLVVLLVFSVVRVTLNEAKFCVSSLKVMSQEDIFRAVADQVIPNIYTNKYSIKKGWRSYVKEMKFTDREMVSFRASTPQCCEKVPMYADAADFMKKNPQCCQMPFEDEGVRRPTWLGYMVGYTNTMSFSFYKFDYTPDGKRKKRLTVVATPSDYSGGLLVSNCGDFRPMTYWPSWYDK